MFTVSQFINLMYIDAYFALWQILMTRLNLSLGVIMLHIQGTGAVNRFILMDHILQEI